MLHLLGYAPVLGLVLVLSLGEPAPATVTVRFAPSAITVDLGETFTLNIVADLPNAVVAWGLDLTIDNGSILSTWPGNTLLPPPAIGSAWADPGYTPDGDRLGGVGFPDSVSGTNVVLATVTFAADALGETDLVLSDDNPFPQVSPPNDLTEGFGLDPTGFAAVAYTLGHVQVVPEPSTALLLMAVGLSVLVRRRSRA